MTRIQLRPHHLLCTQAYVGRGYNDAFVDNMNNITNHLRNNDSANIEIVSGCDDICSQCPKRVGEDTCESQTKVCTMDEKMLHYFALDKKQYIYHDVCAYIKANITSDVLDDICVDCSWYKIADCKQILLGETICTSPNSF